jgi:hypothetical protein
MNIVIGLITKNNQLFLTFDKKAIPSKDVIHDNHKKLFPLRPKLYFGVISSVENELLIIEKVLESSRFEVMKIQDIINLLNENYKIENESAIMLAGIMEDGEAFIWSKKTGGESRLLKRNKHELIYLINTINNSEKLVTRMQEEIIKSEGFVVTAMRKTIEYASTIDRSVSDDYGLILI